VLTQNTVATFVPAQADFQLVLLAKMAFGIHKMLIAMSRANDLRIRNAWVRGSNPLCAPASLPRTSIDVHKSLENTVKLKKYRPGMFGQYH
jgi:hypothetical protein